MNTVEAGRRIAAEAMEGSERDPRDVLSEFDRNIVGAMSVVIKVPLRDPVEVRRHLAILEDGLHQLRFVLEGRNPDRSLLWAVRGGIRQLNKKINAYRAPRDE